MKIAIRKKYIGVLASFLTFVIGYSYIQELLVWLSKQSLSMLILPSVFLTSLIYAIGYWSGLRNQEKIVDEVIGEMSYDDQIKAPQMREHLWQNVWEEAYTLNILKGKIKFTSTWAEQHNFEESIHTPTAVKQELKK